jgi:hypothetical protein
MPFLLLRTPIDAEIQKPDRSPDVSEANQCEGGRAGRKIEKRFLRLAESPKFALQTWILKRQTLFATITPTGD